MSKNPVEQEVLVPVESQTDQKGKKGKKNTRKKCTSTCGNRKR